MQIIHKDVRQGFMKLKPLNATDLYVLSNILEINDLVSAKTVRRVHRKGQEGRSGDKGERIPVFLKIQMQEANFHESSLQPRLRIRGTILEGPEDIVSIGSWHTFNIEIGVIISIKKNEWTSYHFKLLDEAKKSETQVKIALLVIDTSNATMAVVDNFKVKIIFQERFKIPRKASQSKNRNQIIGKYFRSVSEALNRIIKNEKIENLVIGGPGFAKDHFQEFITKNNLKPKIPIQMETTSTALAGGISELISRGTIDRLAADFSIVQERKILDEFLARLGKGLETVAYGLESVFQASQMGAIETLLVLDTLVRSQKENDKRAVRTTLKKSETSQSKIHIVLASSENGEQLASLGGILALLRFPVYYD